MQHFKVLLQQGLFEFSRFLGNSMQVEITHLLECRGECLGVVDPY